jgi:hypothetical protein
MEREKITKAEEINLINEYHKTQRLIKVWIYEVNASGLIGKILVNNARLWFKGCDTGNIDVVVPYKYFVNENLSAKAKFLRCTNMLHSTLKVKLGKYNPKTDSVGVYYAKNTAKIIKDKKVEEPAKQNSNVQQDERKNIVIKTEEVKEPVLTRQENVTNSNQNVTSMPVMTEEEKYENGTHLIVDYSPSYENDDMICKVLTKELNLALKNKKGPMYLYLSGARNSLSIIKWAKAHDVRYNIIPVAYGIQNRYEKSITWMHSMISNYLNRGSIYFGINIPEIRLHEINAKKNDNEIKIIKW